MKKRMKKILAMTMAMTMAASLALTGCGGKKKSSDGEKVLKVWAWDVALMQLQDAAKEYQKDHPDVKFEFEEMELIRFTKNYRLHWQLETELQISLPLKEMYFQDMQTNFQKDF